MSAMTDLLVVVVITCLMVSTGNYVTHCQLSLPMKLVLSQTLSSNRCIFDIYHTAHTLTPSSFEPCSQRFVDSDLQKRIN